MGLRAQGLEPDWNTLSLDAFEQMLGRQLPRPKMRPVELLNPGLLQRPLRRPGAENERAEAQPDVALLPPEPEPMPAPLPLAAAPQVPETALPAPVLLPEMPPRAQAPSETPPLLAEAPAPLPEVTPDMAQALPPAPPKPALPPLPLVATAGFDTARFWEDRRSRETAWSAAAPEEKGAAALEVSRLLMSQMLLPEARSFHSRARQNGLLHDPALDRQWRAMEAMLSVLEGEGLPAPIPEGWDEASLWAVAAGAEPDQIGSPLELTKAVAQLQNHSEPVISAVLPALFDQALRRGDLRVAEGLLRGARELTGLPSTPVYHLMMGRLALAYDMPEEAFDYFVRASQGRDIAAQRARIALADLALLRKDPKLLPALRDILSEGVNQWRHDYEALILRARLAQVAEDLGDIPLALDIMGKIRQDHPGTPEAILAHERGALALAAFAVAVDAGEISLTTYLTSLREVEPFYRLDPVWPIARQALARAFTRAGLQVAAASEYVALQIDLKRIDAPVPPERQRVEIALNEAEAWLANHKTSRAAVALARNGLPRFEELQNRYSRATLQAGVTGAVNVQPAFVSGEDLALYARAARAASLPAAARSAHETMAVAGTLTTQPAEALQAVLTAHETGATAQSAAYFERLQAGPVGADFPQRQDLFTALSTPLPNLQPLSQTLAETMLTRSDAALAAARSLISRPVGGPPPADRAPDPESAL